MKKYIYMAVAAIAALSSCSSDNDPIIEEPGKQELTFTATMEGDDTTARALYNSTNKCAQWETTDQIKINGVLYNAQGAGLTTTFKAATQGQDAQGSTYNAYFPASLYNNTTASFPAEVSETWADGKFNMPMYATSNTTNLQFHNLCGVLKITVKSNQIAAVKRIKVSSKDKAISGAFTVTNNAAVLSDPTAVANTLTVTYSSPVTTTAEGKVFYVAVPAQTYQELKIELDANGNGFTKSMTTKASTNITVERNKIYPITFAASLPDGALAGEFTVNSSGKKVYFSKGNLRATYNGTNYTWGFAANQYDYIGNAKGNTSIDAQSNNAVVDLFGWSTSATNYGINTSKSNSTYSGNFNDWGKNIGDGNTWRTLSNEEWKYLFETRTVRGSKGVNYSYSKHITYGGRKGWVLYPDNYTGNTLSTSANYSSLPEGVVFLPYAGRRLSNVGDVGNYGYYWTSTLNGSGMAYHFSINTNNLYWNSTNRYNGDSVRLVADKK